MYPIRTVQNTNDATQSKFICTLIFFFLGKNIKDKQQTFSEGAKKYTTDNNFKKIFGRASNNFSNKDVVYAIMRLFPFYIFFL